MLGAAAACAPAGQVARIPAIAMTAAKRGPSIAELKGVGVGLQASDTESLAGAPPIPSRKSDATGDRAAMRQTVRLDLRQRRRVTAVDSCHISRAGDHRGALLSPDIPRAILIGELVTV